jgi:glycogen operon protein
MSPTSGVGLPGTVAGLIEKIPYLQDLGITAVELLPTFAFDHREPLPGRASEGHPLYNYWGYDPYAHFAPHPGYCASTGRGHHVHQFRDAVKALHRAGIQVILDVVFNHTAEGNERGPALSLRGFDNQIYYLRDGGSGDQWRYANYSGCGNTLNANHAIVTHLIQECLTYWVRENHVDGFRFDEASVLSRGENGSPLDFPPTVWAIELSPALADTKVIAEAWDAGGLYQVGQFPGRWGQWNGRYRDDIRAFVRGDPGIVGRVASRICGSADIFEQVGEAPFNSVNFVTAHDGFTLNDLVSYNSKHNELNGEQGRDGMDDNRSWNCGVEGATDDPAVERLRRRQIKNFAAILLVSQGVPMLVAGDEIRRTQRGNNNAYCQNNDLSWMNWDMTETHAEIHRFFRLMIAFRKQHTSLERTRFASGLQSHHGLPDISWHGCRLGSPGWDDPNARALAFTLAGLTPRESDLHVLLNMHSEPLVFEVPEIPSRRWRRAVDTAADTPWDISPHGAGMPLAGPTRVREHSVVILVASPEPVPDRPRRNSHRVRSGSHEGTP